MEIQSFEWGEKKNAIIRVAVQRVSRRANAELRWQREGSEVMRIDKAEGDADDQHQPQGETFAGRRRIRLGRAKPILKAFAD